MHFTLNRILRYTGTYYETQKISFVDALGNRWL